jgi:hypothetical protein
MTRKTTARVAGFTFLFYIAVTIASVVLFGRAAGGGGAAAQLASIAQNAFAVRLTIVLDLLGNLSALVLGVTLYAITRECDPLLAMLAMTCRVAEGIGGISTERTLGLLWLAAPTGAVAPDAGAAQAFGAFLLQPGFGPSALFFAVGSAIFSWLLLRGRMIPAVLAWVGVVASVLVVVVFPLQLAGLLGPVGWFGTVTRLMWFPVILFEVVLALWLLIRGVAAPRPWTDESSRSASAAS